MILCLDELMGWFVLGLAILCVGHVAGLVITCFDWMVSAGTCDTVS